MSFWLDAFDWRECSQSSDHSSQADGLSRAAILDDGPTCPAAGLRAPWRMATEKRTPCRTRTRLATAACAVRSLHDSGPDPGRWCVCRSCAHRRSADPLRRRRWSALAHFGGPLRSLGSRTALSCVENVELETISQLTVAAVSWLTNGRLLPDARAATTDLGRGPWLPAAEPAALRVGGSSKGQITRAA